MKKDSKVRLFEVMGRLDKTFKPKLNESFEDVPAADDSTEAPAEEPVEEKSIEEKYEELKAKVGELYALVNGEEAEEETPEIPAETGAENLQEWNFDKKKGDKEEEKEESEEEKEEKPEEKKEIDEAKPKIPVAAIPKVGKK